MTKPACAEHRKATAAPKSSGSPIRPAGMPAAAPDTSPPCSCTSRSVAWSPGCTELTVTPRGATSVARVLRNAVARPAPCSTGSAPRRLAHRDRGDGHHPAPAPLGHGRHRGLAHGHGRQQVELQRGAVGVEVGSWRTCPGAGRRRWGPGCPPRPARWPPPPRTRWRLPGRAHVGHHAPPPGRPPARPAGRPRRTPGGPGRGRTPPRRLPPVPAPGRSRGRGPPRRRRRRHGVPRCPGPRPRRLPAAERSS